MKVINFKMIGSWVDVVNAARTTIDKSPTDKEPNSKWKKQILLAEHSPIRKLQFSWKWVDLKSWISVHFVRHKIGIEHFVQSQRNDRTGVDRDSARQDSLVSHECFANAQAIINISRKRLCGKAHHETTTTWIEMLKHLFYTCPELWKVCVPECVYRGFCPEFNSCGAYKVNCYNNYRDK